MLNAILIPMDLLLILSFAFTPYITRRTELFGVTIPEAHTKDPLLQKLRAAYRNQMLITGAALIAFSVWIGMTYGEIKLGVSSGNMNMNSSEFTPFWLWIAAVAVYLALAFVLYLPKHAAMKKIKTERGWDTLPKGKTVAIIADSTPASHDLVHPAWLISLILPVILTVGVLMLIWQTVPDPVPTHFDLSGVADVWQPKGLFAIAIPVGTQLFMAVVIAVVYLVMRLAKRQIDVDNPNASRIRDIRFRRVMSGWLIGLGVCTELLIGVMLVVPLSPAAANTSSFFIGSLIVFLAIIIVSLLIIMFRVGQGGSRFKEEDKRTAQSAPNTNVNDDSHWKFGQFYFNPKDSALFVEKRFGIGYTVNLARPPAWVLIAALVLLVVGSLLWASTFAQ